MLNRRPSVGKEAFQPAEMLAGPESQRFKSSSEAVRPSETEMLEKANRRDRCQSAV
jgi:hypothetical protein